MSQELKTIEAKNQMNFGLLEVLERRELLYMFAQRQVAVRYRQMLLGVFWAVLEPMGQLLMLTLVFGFLLKIDTAGYPYPIFAFAGLVGWWLGFVRTWSTALSV